jgi:hypothetical protein
MAIDASLVGARGTTTNFTVSTTAGSVTTGESLVAVVSYDPSTTISSIFDTAGNTYSLAANNTGGLGKLALYYGENVTGHASNVLTVNFSNSAFAVAHLIKLTGASAAPYDGASLASGAGTANPATLTSGTFAQADTCVIACAEMNNTSLTGAYSSSNFTVLSSEPDAGQYWTSVVGKLVVASTSAVTPSFSKVSEPNGTGNKGMIVVGFKQAAAGGGPTMQIFSYRQRRL